MIAWEVGEGAIGAHQRLAGIGRLNIGLGGGQQLRGCGGRARPRLLHAGHRLGEVEVLRQGLGLKDIQHRIIETAPPVRRRPRRGLGRTGVAEGGCGRHVREPIIRADGAGREGGQ